MYNSERSTSNSEKSHTIDWEETRKTSKPLDHGRSGNHARKTPNGINRNKANSKGGHTTLASVREKWSMGSRPYRV